MAEVPRVAPGIVPREADYVPSSTITLPEGGQPVVVTVARAPEAAPAQAEPDTPGNPPVRPDVEPPADLR